MRGRELITRLVGVQSEFVISDDVLVAHAILRFVTGYEIVLSTLATGCYLFTRTRRSGSKQFPEAFRGIEVSKRP